MGNYPPILAQNYNWAECGRLEDCAAQSVVNHDHTGYHKKAPRYAGQTVSVINIDRTLWLPATVVHTDHGSYIIKVVGGAEYRWAWDHIHECHPDVVKAQPHTKVDVVGQPIITPSTSEADQQAPTQWAHTAPTAQPPVALATLKEAAAWSPTAAAPVEDTCNCRCIITNQQNCCHTLPI